MKKTLLALSATLSLLAGAAIAQPMPGNTPEPLDGPWAPWATRV